MDKVQQELIAGYLAKARSKLVARELVKQHEWDDVVAYYAAFHAAQAVVGGRAPGETHRGLLTLFSLVLVKTGKREKMGEVPGKPEGRSRNRRLSCRTSMNRRRAGRWKPRGLFFLGQQSG